MMKTIIRIVSTRRILAARRFGLVGSASILERSIDAPPKILSAMPHQNAAYSAIRIPITPTEPALKDIRVP